MARTGPEWVRVVDCAVSTDQQIDSIRDGLAALLVGKNKRLSMIMLLHCAALTACDIGASKAEIQEILIRYYERRIAEQDRDRMERMGL
jgi:hypothetical protein